MGILSGIVNLWKKKNKLRSKISPISREIDKGLGLDKIWDLPGGQLKVQPTPTFDFSEDVNNVLRLGSATVGAGGYRATAPTASANGKTYPSNVIADTLTANTMPAAPVLTPATVPAITPPLPGLRIPGPRDPTGLSSIRTANLRPYTQMR